MIILPEVVYLYAGHNNITLYLSREAAKKSGVGNPNVISNNVFANCRISRGSNSFVLAIPGVGNNPISSATFNELITTANIDKGVIKNPVSIISNNGTLDIVLTDAVTPDILPLKLSEIDDCIDSVKPGDVILGYDGVIGMYKGKYNILQITADSNGRFHLTPSPKRHHFIKRLEQVSAGGFMGCSSNINNSIQYIIKAKLPAAIDSKDLTEKSAEEHFADILYTTDSYINKTTIPFRDSYKLCASSSVQAKPVNSIGILGSNIEELGYLKYKVTKESAGLAVGYLAIETAGFKRIL